MAAGSAARGLSITLDDEPGATDLDVVDIGLGRSNDEAAPLHEVRPLACFLRDADGRVRGGAVGRRWGPCCELQQLWVEPALRRQGLGARLVHAFEGRARLWHPCDLDGRPVAADIDPRHRLRLEAVHRLEMQRAVNGSKRMTGRCAPFDHPELYIPNGHLGNDTTVYNDGFGRARDSLMLLPATGKNGATPLKNFLE